MPSHMSAIGFPLNSEEEFWELGHRAAEHAEELTVAGGRYLKWCDDSGAQLWVQIDKSDSLVGMNPHFQGNSSVRVGLTAAVARPHDTALDGAFHGWADPQSEDAESSA